MDCAYVCLGAKAKQELGTFGDKRVVLCDMVFEDEHGNVLAPVADAVVVIEAGQADTQDYAENIIENATVEQLAKLQQLCDNNPHYHVYNTEDLYNMLQRG